MSSPPLLPTTDGLKSPRRSIPVRELLIATQYVVLWTIAAMLVRAAAEAGTYRFNLHIAMFLTESTKFVCCLVYYISTYVRLLSLI